MVFGKWWLVDCKMGTKMDYSKLEEDSVDDYSILDMYSKLDGEMYSKLDDFHRDEYAIPKPPPAQHLPNRFVRKAMVILGYGIFLLAIAFTIYPFFLNIDYKFSFNYQNFESGFNFLINDYTDPVGDKIGRPSLAPDKNHSRYGANAMVSSDVPICSSMGKEILIKGGNAADAAITVALCIGSVNLHLSGIGGGAYIVSLQQNDTISIDAREMAPSKAYKNMFDHYPLLAQFGGLANAIPGELKGLNDLYNLHGSGILSWKQLIDPVIELNMKGWEASEIWIRSLNKMTSLVFPIASVLEENWDFIYNDPIKHRDLVETGDIIKRPNLASTLRLIAENGSSDIFYDPNGPIVKSLVETSQKLGGILTKDDFAAYKTNITSAIKYNFELSNQNLTIYTSLGTSSGLSLISGINYYSNLQKKFPIDQIKSLPKKITKEILEVHRIIESMKWISSTRTYLGDLNSTYFNKLVEKFSGEEWSTNLLENNKYSDFQTFPWKHYEPEFELNKPHGTSHFSIVDSEGGAVSMTTTVNLLFGSMVYDNNTGIILNDEMDDFSLPFTRNAFNLTPSIHNYIHPYKRPLSSMTPLIIKDSQNQIKLIIGAAGGSRISTAVFQGIVRFFYNNESLLNTISYPRLHHQLIPEYAMVEDFDIFEDSIPHQNASVIDTMTKALGHGFAQLGALTVMNAISKSNESFGWNGVSDYWRKRGAADGY